MEYRIPDSEDLIECPYEKSHMIRAKRMQYHLMKCRQNYKGKEFGTCPFNARHAVPKPELRHHIATCPDKAILEKDIAFEQTKNSGDGEFFKGCTDVPAYNSYTLSSNENWDAEVNPKPRIGVDPGFFERVQYRQLAGMSTSEKKHFHRTLNPDPDFSEPKTASPQDQMRQNGETKLRLPKQASKAYSMSLGQQPQLPLQQQVPANVFAYSLAMAGIGRGRGQGGSPQPVVNIPQYDATSDGRGSGTATMMSDSRAPAPHSLNTQTAAPTPSHPQLQPQKPAYVRPVPNGHVSSSQPTGTFTSYMGIGRGVGRGLGSGQPQHKPDFVIPKLNPASSHKGTPDFHDDMPVDRETSPDLTGEISDVHPVEDAKKSKRKLLKKLRQIEIIEDKTSNGTPLTTEEKEKMSRKMEIEDQIAALGI